MITDKFKSYSKDGVRVTLYRADANIAGVYDLAVITSGNKLDAKVELIGGRYRLVILDCMLVVSVSYWGNGDTAIQVGIDSMTP